MLSAEVKRHFPLRSLDDVLQLFRKQLQLPEPDLALLSIITGFLESTLISAAVDNGSCGFPVVEWDFVEELYKKFQRILSVIVEVPKVSTAGKHSKQATNNSAAAAASAPPPVATREIIKRVSDLIWNSLIRSTYKDRAHLQSLYSYLAASKLDCFGVAFAVVAGCQLLGYQDVHLAISEDHAWVVFNGNQETIEVTWHGKGFEDKRGQPVSVGVESQSWLYLSGHPVVCDRHMEVSALVLAINPSLNLTSACLEVTELQQRLLWMLYDHGYLQKYPMGLGNLGELEEFAATGTGGGTVGSVDKSVIRPSSEELYRQSVISARRYYKNFHVYPYTYQGSYYLRKFNYRQAFAAWADAGDVIRRYIYSRDDEELYKELLEIANEHIPSVMKTESSGHSARSILRDPNCFANLLRFYDGICKWEEGSVTPILHIGWAKPLVSTIAKFDYDIRSQVIIETAEDDEEFPEVEEPIPVSETNNNSIRTMNNNNNINNGTVSADMPPTLAALTAACGEKILNPNFLTGGELQPFTTESKESKSGEVSDDHLIGDAKIKEEGTLASGDEKKNIAGDFEHVKVEIVVLKKEVVVEDNEPKRPEIKLFSQKMKGLRNLLLAEKLNTQAILLQVTAQSHCGGGGGKKGSRSGGWNGNDSMTGGSKEAANNQNGGSSAGGSALTGTDGEVTGSGRPKRARRE